VFLVGESAHLNPPWGGHGFNTCVGDAVNIAWKIAAVERGWATPGLLDSYEPERRGVVEQTVASAETNMRSLAGELPSDGAAIQSAKRAEFHSLGLVLGYSYAGSPVIQPGAEPGPAASGGDSAGDVSSYTPEAAPGARLPHAWLPDGASLYDRLGAGFTLLGPVGPGDPAVAALADRARQRGIPLAVLQAPPDYPWGREFLLVRPDQHVAWRARDAEQIDLDLVTGHLITGEPVTGDPGRPDPGRPRRGARPVRLGTAAARLLPAPRGPRSHDDRRPRPPLTRRSPESAGPGARLLDGGGPRGVSPRD
jgi:hypothetical protein